MLRSMAATAVNIPILLVVACALIDAQGRILLSERPKGKNMAGLWEFPGGKIEQGETPEQALQRELSEEVGIDVQGKNLVPFTFASYPCPDFHLLMPLYLCRSWSGKLYPREGQLLQWVEVERLTEYPMPPADKPLIAALKPFLEGLFKGDGKLSPTQLGRF